MNEKNRNRREWVKTAAIIFLSAMLVLTFFSNTIMNYSLPEVATQYVEPGSITSKIRGTGTVESSDPYSVKLKTKDNTNANGVYEVESVEVKKGDIVEKGQLLCNLASAESTELETAKKELEGKIREYEIAILQGQVSDGVLDNAQSGVTASMEIYQARLKAKDKEIQALKDEVEEAQKTLDAWKIQQNKEYDPTKEKKALEEAQKAYDEVAERVDAANEEIKAWQAEIDANNKIICDYEDGKMIVDGSGNQVPAVTEVEYETAKANNQILEERIAEKNAEIAEDKAKLPELKEALRKAQKKYDDKKSDAAGNAEEAIEDWTKEVANRQKKVEDAEAAKAQLITDIVTELEWSDTLKSLKENISKLDTESVGGEVYAPISGEIIAVNVKSGEDTPGDGILFTIQPAGKGYTMQFSVSNEQAKRVSIGMVADLVNAWRYTDVVVMLSSIRPDPNNPGQSKQLRFDISGDVADGQSLSVSLGDRSAQYELTVPNSAIREDNNGKFILTIETKSTPLSNRYIATRVDVEVIASDDTKTAIKAPLYGYEYVITTSTAPVKAGDQVRLANNG